MLNKRMSPLMLYIIGIMLVISGITIFIYLLISTISQTANSGQQIIAPGKEKIFLQNEGKYIIFYESKSVLDSNIYDTESFDISGLEVKIYAADTSKPVELKRSNGSTNYHIGKRQGTSIYKFEIQAPAEYVIETKYKNNGPEVVLNITENFIFEMVGSILLMVAVVLVLPSAGVAIIVLTIINKKYSMRKYL